MEMIGVKVMAHARSFSDMMIEVLKAKRAGNYEAEAAGEVITAEARFNLWFANEVKKKPGSKEHARRLLDIGEELLAQCAEAVDTFTAGGPNETLRSSLWDINRQLNKMRE